MSFEMLGTKVFYSTIYLSFVFLHVYATKNAYSDLLSVLFKEYDTGIRPVQNAQIATNVSIRYGLLQLLNVEEKIQTVELASFMELSWVDEHLTWNPAEYGNIAQFRYPYDKVWKPDIILINTPDLNDGPFVKDVSTNVIINHDGTIVNSFTAVFKVTCRHFSIVDFPFDQHNCYLEIGSYTYNINEVDLNEAVTSTLPASMTYVTNSEWNLDLVRFEKITETECCPNETYPYMRIHIKLNRKPLYYFIHLIIPTILTCYVAFFGMFNPTSSSGDRSDKAFLGLCTLFTISLLLLNVSSEMPITSDSVTLMGVFLGVYLIFVASAVIVTCIIMNIHLKWLNGRPVPKWAKEWFVHRLSKYLWLDVADSPETETEDTTPVRMHKFRNAKKDIGSNEDKTNELSRLVEQKFQPVNDVLSKLVEKQVNYEYQQKNKDEWGRLAAVLDRIFLIVFVVISTIFSVGLFIRFF